MPRDIPLKRGERKILPLALPALWLLTLCSLTAASAEEPVDWAMVNRIRDEGLHRSEVMSTLEHLTDAIGPRLTGSPQMQEANEWTRQQLEEWGLENAHLEAVEFGRGWSFSRTAVHLLQPREMPLIALPKAWTPGTGGPVKGQAMRVKIDAKKDFEKYAGKLAGKILFLDDSREIESGGEPAVKRLSEQELEGLEEFEIPDGKPPAWRQKMRKRWRLSQELNQFLVEEQALATVSISSRDGGLVRVMGGGSREPGGNPGVPSLVMAAEQYNWIIRLLGDAEEEAEPAAEDGDEQAEEEAEPAAEDGAEQAEAEEPAGAGEAADPQSQEAADGDAEAGATEAGDAEQPEAPVVELEIEVRARFHDDDTQSYNTIAEIPGSGDGLVMAGAHLDSWHAGAGATDNAAGCAVAMEAVRILKALGVQPRRTIRIGLWTGEEQGLFGSRVHVENHFATVPMSADPKQDDLPVFMRDYEGEVEVKPDHAGFSAYFNLDNGSGKIRGIWSQENAAAVPIFEAWLAPFNDLGADTVTTRNTYGTDHQAFDRIGLPGFQFIQDGLDYRSRTHHTNADVLDHAVREDLVQASVVLASFLYHAATRAEPLPRKPMPRYEPR